MKDHASAIRDSETRKDREPLIQAQMAVWNAIGFMWAAFGWITC